MTGRSKPQVGKEIWQLNIATYIISFNLLWLRYCRKDSDV